MLDRTLCDEVHDKDVAALALAPGARNALLQLRRVPREVEVHHDARGLQVEPDAAGFGRKENAAVGIRPEPLELSAATVLPHASRMDGKADSRVAKPLLDQFEHPHPFGKHDDLASGIGRENVLKDTDRLVRFRGLAYLLVKYVAAVAEHSHARKVALKAVEFFLCQRTLLRLPTQPRHLHLELAIAGDLLVGQRDEIVLVRPPREFVLHHVLSPTQHNRRRLLMEVAEVLHSGRLTAFVELVVEAVEAEEASEEPGVHELGDGVEFVDPILERGAGQNECKAGREPLERACRLGLPVLDTLRLVEDDEIGPEDFVYLLPVSENLLVVRDDEEGVGFAVTREPFAAVADEKLGHDVGEKLDLVRPLALEGSRDDNENAPHLRDLLHEQRGGDRLHRLPEAHFVGKYRPSIGGEM